MSLITFTIPNLTNGVSQQPATIRLPNQGEEQINANCRVTDGLSKRKPLERLFSTQITTLDVGDFDPYMFIDDEVKFHTIQGKDANGNEVTAQFFLECNEGELYVIYVEGPEKGRVVGLGKFAYLSNTSKNDIKFLTDGDTTYILNKEKKVALTGSADTTTRLVNRQGALTYIQTGYFGTRYSIKLEIFNQSTNALVSSVEAYYDTAASTSTTISDLQTSYIRTQLQTALQSAMTTAGGTWTTNITLVGDKSYLQATINNDTYADSYYIRATTFSSTARTAIYAFNGVCLDVANLPPAAPAGYTVRVSVDSSDVDDDYYLKYSNSELGWIETVQLGINKTIDPYTMPVIIKNVLEDYTTIDTSLLTIKAREAGDTISAPEPSFVGYRLNDMFIFSNRLGFLSRNNVIMSKIDEYDTFYRTTLATSLSSDRVDLSAAVPSTRYSELNYAVPFDKELVLFGDAAQYSLSANTGFDVKTANLSTLTEYESSTLVPPLNIGSSIYFPITRGEFSAIFDLARRTDVGLTAEESTQHVPIYIKGNIVEMVHSSTEMMVFVRTAEDPKTIYVQNRFAKNGELLQNAWHKWTFSNNVVHMFIIGSKLFVNTADEFGDILHVSYIDISLSLLTQSESTNIEFTPFLDYIQFVPAGSTISTSDLGADYFVAPDMEVNLKAITSTGAIISGLTNITEELVTKDLWIGIPYKFSYTFSEQTPAQYGQNGKTVMQYARLNIQSMKVSYQKTSKFDIKIEQSARNTYYNKFTGNILGGLGSLLGRINLYTGVFKFPVHSKADQVTITIESEYPYPCTFNTIEWQGKLTNNSGRM